MTHQLVTFFLTLSCLLLLWISEKKCLYRSKWRLSSIIMIIQLLLTTYLVVGSFGQIVKAQWGPEDDHEIVYYMGEDREIKPSEFFSTLVSTEVGKFGTSLRARPVYYSLRILEMIIWGPNPMLWYSFRLLLCVASVILYWKVFEYYYSTYFAGIMALTLFFHISTIDLFTRLGPGETYGYFAVSLFFWSFSNIVSKIRQKIKVSNTILIVLSLSYIVAIGVKESLLILVVPILLLLLFAIIKKERKVQSILLLLIIPTIILLLGIIKALIASGYDFYVSDVFTLSRLLPVVAFLSNPYFRVIIPIVVVVTAFSVDFIKKKSISQEKIQTLITHLIIIWTSIVVIISQFVIYAGALSNGNRYDFPATLAVVFLIASLLYCIKTIVILASSKRLQILFNRIVVVGSLVGIFVISFHTSSSLRHFSQRSIEIVSYTQKYTQLNELITDKIQKHYSNAPIVLEIAFVQDFEQIESMYRFFRFYGIKNEIGIHSSISVDALDEGKLSALYNMLLGNLLERSINGNSELTRLPSIDQSKCLSIDTNNPIYQRDHIDDSKVYCAKHLLM